jgi:hypothetical protein
LYRKKRFGKLTLGIPPKVNLDKFFRALETGKCPEGASLLRGLRGFEYGGYFIQQVRKTPSLYDILSCLTSYDPGSFSDFCDDYGYDTDSRKAHKLWEAVHEEYSNVSRIFAGHMDELAEIN